MRRQAATVPKALHSVAACANLPQPWSQQRTSPPIFAPSVGESLYGLPGEDADVQLRRLEAVLLIAREPMNSRKISQYAGLEDGTQARALIKRLNRWYDDVGRAFRVEEVAGGFQMRTRPQFAPWVRRLGSSVSDARLSPPALETLAVVAYRQPVLRADIEAIRGVNSGEILRILLERDLIRVAGRSQELGRPFLYATTRKFLELFGLANLEDLPHRGEFAPAEENVEKNVPPLHNLSATSYTTDTQARHTLKEIEVTVTTSTDLLTEEEQLQQLWRQKFVSQPQLSDDDEDEDEDDFDDDDEDDDDFDDEDEDFDDEEDEEEEDDLDDVDEDFDDEWEEVDDEDIDEEEEEDDDWDDDDDDDDDEEDDEEDEDWD